MANCTNCGAPLNEGVKFCQDCGADLSVPVAPPSAPASQPATQPQPVPPPQQTPAYTAPVTKKSKTPLIIGIVVAVIAIVIILVVVLMFSGGLGGSASQLEGTWEYNIGGVSLLYKFNSDGSFEVGSGTTVPAGNWNVDGDQLCFSYSSAIGGVDSCYTYSISNNQLTLSYQGNVWMTLTKK